MNSSLPFSLFGKRFFLFLRRWCVCEYFWEFWCCSICGFVFFAVAFFYSATCVVFVFSFFVGVFYVCVLCCCVSAGTFWFFVHFCFIPLRFFFYPFIVDIMRAIRHSRKVIVITIIPFFQKTFFGLS